VSRRRGHSQAIVDLRVDGDLFVRHAGDGLIVSSAAGSTGYSFSAGGPRLMAIIVTPLAPHAAFNRPVVLSAGEPVTLDVVGDSSSLALEVDGRTNVDVPPGSRLTVDAVANAGRVIRLGRTSFAQRARRRLGIAEAYELLLRHPDAPEAGASAT
jgi:NAD+ kinase